MTATAPRARDADLASADIPTKLTWLEGKYLKTARDLDFQDYLREIMEIGPDGTILPRPAEDPLTGEKRGLAIIGGSNEGKSTLLKRNLGSLAGFERMAQGSQGNYLLETVPQNATEKGLGEEVARTTGYGKFRGRPTVYEIWKVASHRMRERGVGLLCIDEVHHILRSGSGRDTKGSLQSLKSLLQGPNAVGVIIAGVPALEDLLAQDEETDRRFLKLRLESVKSSSGEMERLKLFIDRCCTSLGIASPVDPTLAERIVFACRGQLGGSAKFAKAIIRRAIIGGQGQIDLHAAGKVFEMHRSGTGPSPFAPDDWSKLRRSLISQGWRVE